MRKMRQYNWIMLSGNMGKIGKKKLVGVFFGGIYEEKATMHHKVQEYFPSDGYNKDTFVRRVGHSMH